MMWFQVILAIGMIAWVALNGFSITVTWDTKVETEHKLWPSLIAGVVIFTLFYFAGTFDTIVPSIWE